jgi:hypothetical protein
MPMGVAGCDWSDDSLGDPDGENDRTIGSTGSSPQESRRGGDGDGDSGGPCDEGLGLIPVGDGDCYDQPSEACIAYGELLATCIPILNLDEEIAGCERSLAYYTSINPLCGANYEALMACLSPLSCEEYDGPTPEQCLPFMQGINAYCNI